jgi:hypothetical protein
LFHTGVREFVIVVILAVIVVILAVIVTILEVLVLICVIIAGAIPTWYPGQVPLGFAIAVDVVCPVTADTGVHAFLPKEHRALLIATNTLEIGTPAATPRHL